LTAEDIMTVPVVVASEGTTLGSAVSTMVEAGVDVLPITDHRGVMVGVLSVDDFVGPENRAASLAFQVPACFEQCVSEDDWRDVQLAGGTLTVEHVMSRDVVSANEDESVSTLAGQLALHDVRQIPVLRNGVPVGMVTKRDLLKLLLWS
jgi:CBS-domain-containing membrane protein